MMTTTTGPRIYVADLADYNAGRLHGVWIDLEDFDSVEHLQAVIEGEVLRSHITGHEEWAIHDYEGFGSISVGEYDSLETVLAHASRLGENAGKYEAWINARGISDAENFDPERVQGPYESPEDYQDQYLEAVFGSLDIEEALIHAGVDKRMAEALASFLEWRDYDSATGILTEVSTGSYSREYYEVEE